jgi:hypothetical protein
MARLLQRLSVQAAIAARGNKLQQHYSAIMSKFPEHVPGDWPDESHEDLPEVGEGHHLRKSRGGAR